MITLFIYFSLSLELIYLIVQNFCEIAQESHENWCKLTLSEEDADKLVNKVLMQLREHFQIFYFQVA